MTYPAQATPIQDAEPRVHTEALTTTPEGARFGAKPARNSTLRDERCKLALTKTALLAVEGRIGEARNYLQWRQTTLPPHEKGIASFESLSNEVNEVEK